MPSARRGIGEKLHLYLIMIDNYYMLTLVCAIVCFAALTKKESESPWGKGLSDSSSGERIGGLFPLDKFKYMRKYFS